MPKKVGEKGQPLCILEVFYNIKFVNYFIKITTNYINLIGLKWDLLWDLLYIFKAFQD